MITSITSITPITCAILEDDPKDARLLERYVEKVGGLQLVAVFNNAAAMQQYLVTNDIALLITDIELPDMNAFALMESLPHKPNVIFCTGHNNINYATKGYRINVIDYLTKPLLYTEFANAIGKAREKLGLGLRHEGRLTAYVAVPHDGGWIRMPLADIVYVESTRNYVNVYFVSGKPLLKVRHTLKEMMEKLPALHFIQTHKSYIIALRMAMGCTRREVQVRNCEQALPLGPSYREAVKRAIGGY